MPNSFTFLLANEIVSFLFLVNPTFQIRLFKSELSLFNSTTSTAEDNRTW